MNRIKMNQKYTYLLCKGLEKRVGPLQKLLLDGILSLEGDPLPSPSFKHNDAKLTLLTLSPM